MNHSIADLIENIIAWLRINLAERGKEGFVLGISGGIDSWVLMKIISEAGFEKKCFNLVYTDQDMNSINLNSKNFSGFDFETVDLRELYQLSIQITNPEPSGSWLHRAINTNIKARLREIYFYNQARASNYLVIGTVNKAEFQIGYFVKNSSIGDLLPMANLNKSTIRKMAAELGATYEMVNLKASGCVDCLYAEEEWGISEQNMDKILAGKFEGVREKELEYFMRMQANSCHKREFVPVFPHYDGDTDGGKDNM